MCRKITILKATTNSTFVAELCQEIKLRESGVMRHQSVIEH